ncbi:MAG: DUF4956 domain-containing protein [Flavobacteriales bacterium]
MDEFKFLEIPFYDDDMNKLLFKFILNTAVLTIIIRFIYYPITRRKDFLFTFFLISLVTFLICFVLKKNDLGLGLALGLFAVFGIIRYRTDAVPIKEMTYLFVVIGISVINALTTSKTSYLELIFTNFSVVALIYILEKVILLKHESSQIILYEKIELIKPERRAEMIADLENRTGLKINRISIQKINFLRDTAQIVIYYYDKDRVGGYNDSGSVSNSSDDDD